MTPAFLAGVMFAARVGLFALLAAHAARRLARPLVVGRATALQPLVRRARIQLLIASVGLASQVPHLVQPPERTDLSSLMLTVFMVLVAVNGIDQLNARR